MGPSFSEPKMKVPFGTIFGAGIETDESCDDFRNRVRTWLIEIVRGARPFKFPVLDPVFDVLTYEMAPVVIAPKRPVCMPFCFGAPRVTHVVSSEDIGMMDAGNFVGNGMSDFGSSAVPGMMDAGNMIGNEMGNAGSFVSDAMNNMDFGQFGGGGGFDFGGIGDSVGGGFDSLASDIGGLF
jgi:hypothetical protein